MTKRKNTRRRRPEDGFVTINGGVITRHGLLMGSSYGFDDTTGYHEVDPGPPPPPPKPSAKEIRQTFSDTYERRDMRFGIMLPTLAAVKEAIAVQGGSRTTVAQTAAAISPPGSDGRGALMFLTAEAMADRGSFVKAIERDIDTAFAPDGRQSYQGDWDYGVPSGFHKMRIGVKRSGDRFELSVNGPYTSNHETRLAEKLGLEPEYVRTDHAITWASVGDRYRIPHTFLHAVQALVDPEAPAGALLDAFKAHLKARDEAPPSYDEGKALAWTAPRIRAAIELTGWRVRPLYDLRRARADVTPDDLERLALRFEEREITGPARAYDRDSPTLYGAGGVELRLWPATPADAEHVRAVSDAIARLYDDLPPAFDASEH